MTDYLSDIRFEDPWLLLLLLLVPVYIIFNSRYGERKFVAFNISTAAGVTGKNRVPGRTAFLPLLFLLRLLSFVLIVIALARPQTGFSNKRVSTQGIDIVLALDVSPSMYAVDFKPNRMEAAKVAAKQFIDNRPNDRIGLVVFAGEAFTQCPATLDHELLKKQVDNADGWYLKDGTALGDGLFMAVNRLADSTNINSKVIILLTDGVRTGGQFSPLDAANGAKQLNIRVYTIGVGTESDRPIPVVDKNGRMIFELDPRISFDEPTLKQVAELTGGQYFKANSKEKLNEIYQQIDTIEKHKIDVNITERFDDKFYFFALAGIILLMVEIFLRYTVFRTLT